MFGIKTMKIKEQAKEIKQQAVTIKDQEEKIRFLGRDKSRLDFHIEQLEKTIQDYCSAMEAVGLRS